MIDLNGFEIQTEVVQLIEKAIIGDNCKIVDCYKYDDFLSLAVTTNNWFNRIIVNSTEIKIVVHDFLCKSDIKVAYEYFKNTSS